MKKKRSPLFPACAGVILHWVVPNPDSDTFPRVCGGDPLKQAAATEKGFFSPRVRG